MTPATRFRGLGTALVTPFARDHTVDYAAVRRLAERQIEGGVDVLVPAGTTGEGATLTPDEHVRVVEEVVRTADGRVPVLAGSGANSTHEAVNLATRLAAAGADGLLLVTPYYNKPTIAGLELHYRIVSEAVGVPIVLYNVPGRTGLNLTVEHTLRLARIPGVIGIKEASGNVLQILELLIRRPASFLVLSGDDAITLPLLAAGADGVVSVVSNEDPAGMSRLVHAGLEGDLATARAVQERLFELMNANFIESNPGPVKAGMAAMGLLDEVLRPPLAPVLEATRAALRTALESAGLLGAQASESRG
ncbi:MAG TPA: 4-hydroxy-tetrahydrodipicolinate synthase [Gemmatimonadota bacterium]